MDPEQFASWACRRCRPTHGHVALPRATESRRPGSGRACACGDSTDRVSFDPDTGEVEPAFCDPCEAAAWDDPAGELTYARVPR